MVDDSSREVLGRLIFNSLPVPLALKSLPDRRFILWNKAAEKFLGIDSKDVLESTGDKIFESHTVDDCLAAEKKAKAEDSRERFRVHAFPGPSGSTIDFEVTIVPLKEKRNSFLLFLFEPVRAARTLEDEVKRLREEMVSVVSEQRKTFSYLNHQVRTSLSNITGMLETLLDSDLESPIREMGETALISSIAILDVLNETAVVQKQGIRRLSLESVDFDPRRLLEVLVEQNADLAFRKELDLTCVIQPEVPASIVGDPGCLQQVIQNLIENFIQATPKGQIRVKMLVQSSSPDRVVLRIEFYDMKEEICRLAGEGEASTAGRASAKLSSDHGTILEFLHAVNITELLGGKMIADARSDGHSCFSFICPFKIRDALPEPPGQIITQAHDRLLMITQAQDRLLLVAHPQEATRLAISEQWKAWGGKTIEADSERKTIQQLKERREVPDRIALIALDFFWTNSDDLRPILSDRHLHEIMGIPCIVVSPWEFGDKSTTRHENPGIPTLVRPIVPSKWLDLLAWIFRSDPTEAEKAGFVDSQIKVLLVDDNRTNLRVAARILENLGAHVSSVESGKEALKLLAGQIFDLVFLACIMPEMDGFEVARRIRKNEKEGPHRTPIVAISANVQPEYQSRSLSAGMDGFIAKPFKKADFKWALERIGRKSKKDREGGNLPLRAKRSNPQ